MEKLYDGVRFETPNDLWLKTSLICAKASNSQKVSQCVKAYIMRIVVANGQHKSQYLINIHWVTMANGYDVARFETPNDALLKTSLMMCAKESSRCILLNENGP